ncbi:MAG: slipin family protein [Candidatus Aramenus sp.]|nr:slipin family protein [Candidatus Aramenus sp.]
MASGSDVGLIVGLVFLLIIILVFVGLSFRIVKEWQRAVVLRLGRVLGVKGPGIIFLIPFVDRPVIVDLRINNVDIPPQTVITKDNVTVSIDAVVYYKVVDPIKAVANISNYNTAVINIAQTSLRDIIGQMLLDEVLSERDAINRKLQEILDNYTEGWGVKVTAVTVRDVKLPADLSTAMAQYAAADRLRKAKVILSEGERQAASILADASKSYKDNPIALQIRFLETLSDISQKGGLIIVVPAGQEIYPTISTAIAAGISNYKKGE